MGQPITVTARPGASPSIRLFDLNRSLTGMEIERYHTVEDTKGDRPPDVLARRLFDLGATQVTIYSSAVTVQAPPESLARLVRDLSPLPSMLVNHRFDILAWNPEMTALMLDFGALPVEQRNTVWLCMLYPPLYDFYRDRDRVVRDQIADLRAAWAAHPEDTALGELVEELTSHSTEFARLWPKRCVRVNGRGLTPLLHPRVGPLTVEYEVLTPLQDPDQRLIICRAADTASQAALDAIAREAERPRLQVL